MTSSQIDKMLEDVMPGRVYRHVASVKKLPCIAWSPTGYGLIHGDNAPAIKALRFAVALLTQTDDDPALLEILKVLAEHGVAFGDPETSYNDEFALLRHEIKCEVTAHGYA